MVDFPPSAHALKRVVVGLESELAPILSLEMAAGDVQAHHRKHATRKPVKVEAFVSELCFSLLFPFLCVKPCLKMLQLDIDCGTSWLFILVQL